MFDKSLQRLEAAAAVESKQVFEIHGVDSCLIRDKIVYCKRLESVF